MSQKTYGYDLRKFIGKIDRNLTGKAAVRADMNDESGVSLLLHRHVALVAVGLFTRYVYANYGL